MFGVDGMERVKQQDWLWLSECQVVHLSFKLFRQTETRTLNFSVNGFIHRTSSLSFARPAPSRLDPPPAGQHIRNTACLRYGMGYKARAP